MADVRVTCITKPDPDSPHEHITHLGNPASNWKWTREEVIASIDAGTNTFFVIDPRNGKRSEVGVVRVAGRAPYLRTHADGDWNHKALDKVSRGSPAFPFCVLAAVAVSPFSPYIGQHRCKTVALPSPSKG